MSTDSPVEVDTTYSLRANQGTSLPDLTCCTTDSGKFTARISYDSRFALGTRYHICCRDSPTIGRKERQPSLLQSAPHDSVKWAHDKKKVTHEQLDTYPAVRSERSVEQVITSGSMYG